MKYDGKLVWRIQNLPRDVKEKVNAEDVLRDYETAIQLSNGPIPDRCAHWEKKAMAMVKKMENILIQHPVPEPAKKKEKKNEVQETDADSTGSDASV